MAARREGLAFGMGGNSICCSPGGYNEAMALLDEMRMDRTVMSVVTTETPSDAKAYWQTKSMEERLIALELTRQVFNGYDPDTTRFQRVLEVLEGP